MLLLVRGKWILNRHVFQYHQALQLPLAMNITN
jgi:hypothetical protein